MSRNEKPRFFYGYIVVSASFAIMTAVQGLLTSFGIFLEPMLVEFGWTRASASGALSLAFILAGFVGMATGRLSDRFGPRLIVTAGGLLTGLGYIWMSQVSAIWQLYLFWGVMIGTGIGAQVIPLSSTIARWFVTRRGVMTSLVMIGAGMVIMPPIASQLIISYGWRNSYIIIGIAILVLITLAAQFLKREPESIGQLPYSGTEVNQEDPTLATSELPLREAIHTRQLWILLIILFCLGFLGNAIRVHIVIHATGLGVPAFAAANILTIIGGLTIAGRIVIGNVADRTGSRLALITCFIPLTAASFWLLVAQEVWMLYLFATVFGFGFSAAVLHSPAVAELFGLCSHGILMGVTGIGLTIGAAIGPVLIGYIFDITGSYQLGFLICAVVGIIGLILAQLLKPIRSLPRDIQSPTYFSGNS